VGSEGLIIADSESPSGGTFIQLHHSLQQEESGNIFENQLKGNHILASIPVLPDIKKGESEANLLRHAV
jgi:hypothetical protein